MTSCQCPAFDPSCPLAWTLRRWELCSGRCPAERPCTPAQSEAYRAGVVSAATPHGELLRGLIQPTGFTLSMDPKLFAFLKAADCPGRGPGTELKNLLATLGVAADGGCGCDAYVCQMDRWGADGCREHAWEIIARLTHQAEHVGWGQKVAMAAKAVKAGLTLNPLGLIPALLETAIRRAEGNDG